MLFSPRLFSPLRLGFFVVAFVGISGCAAVPPRDRSYMAKKKMQMDPDAEASALEQHVYEYREGASGGYGSVGGGCGCN
jgi:hypothetical protein